MCEFVPDLVVSVATYLELQRRCFSRCTQRSPVSCTRLTRPQHDDDDDHHRGVEALVAVADGRVAQAARTHGAAMAEAPFIDTTVIVKPPTMPAAPRRGV
jgi:hypothetical protein